nr:lysE family amino acid transporter [Pantoea sp.]
MPHVSGLLLVFITGFVATASPGRGNMAIMGTAMRSGRQKSARTHIRSLLCATVNGSGRVCSCTY